MVYKRAMSPIQPAHKRYTVLNRALKSAKISKAEFNHCVENGISLSAFRTAPKISIENGITRSPRAASLAIHNQELVHRAANTPLPPDAPDPIDVPEPPATLIPLNTKSVHVITQVSPKSPRYDVEATEDIIPYHQSTKRHVPTWEPFHGEVRLMSLQEKIDALSDQVLNDVEEGKCVPRTTLLRRKWWTFGLLGV